MHNANNSRCTTPMIRYVYGAYAAYWLILPKINVLNLYNNMVYINCYAIWYSDPPYWGLNIFWRAGKSVVSSIRNSKSGKSKLNMKYQFSSRGCWTPIGGVRAALHPPLGRSAYAEYGEDVSSWRTARLFAAFTHKRVITRTIFSIFSFLELSCLKFVYTSFNKALSH